MRRIKLEVLINEELDGSVYLEFRNMDGAILHKETKPSISAACQEIGATIWEMAEAA